MAWVHCNACFAEPSAKGKEYFISNCQHLLCFICCQKPVCGVCQNQNFKALKVDSKLPQKAKDLFTDPVKSLSNSLGKIASIRKFQEAQIKSLTFFLGKHCEHSTTAQTENRELRKENARLKREISVQTYNNQHTPKHVNAPSSLRSEHGIGGPNQVVYPKSAPHARSVSIQETNGQRISTDPMKSRNVPSHVNAPSSLRNQPGIQADTSRNRSADPTTSRNTPSHVNAPSSLRNESRIPQTDTFRNRRIVPNPRIPAQRIGSDLTKNRITPRQFNPPSPSWLESDTRQANRAPSVSAPRIVPIVKPKPMAPSIASGEVPPHPHKPAVIAKFSSKSAYHRQQVPGIMKGRITKGTIIPKF